MISIFLLQSSGYSQFNWPTVIASVVGGSAIGAIVTFLGSFRLKKSDFEYDYRKYILSKRKEAYEEIESLIVSIHHFNGSLRTFQGLNEAEKEKSFKELQTKFDEIRKRVLSTTSSPSMWVNPSLIERFRALELYLKPIGKSFEHSEMNFKKTDVERIRVGITYVLKRFFKDIAQLDKIEKFKTAVLEAIVWDQRMADQALLEATNEMKAI